MADFVITNAQLLDTTAGERRPDASVRVEGDRIAEVVENGAPISPPEGVQVIDAGGRTVMPGLTDAHVHSAITTMDLGAMAPRPATR